MTPKNPSMPCELAEKEKIRIYEIDEMESCNSLICHLVVSNPYLIFFVFEP